MLADLNTFELEDIVNEGNLKDLKMPSFLINILSSALNELGYTIDNFTSFAITHRKLSKPTNFALIPNQYFFYAAKFYNFANALYQYFVIYEQIKEHGERLLGSYEKIYETISNDTQLRKVFELDDDVLRFAKFIDSENNEFRFGSKRLINEEGKPRGSSDCFGSVILNLTNLPAASSSIFGSLVYDLSCKPIAYKELFDFFKNNQNVDKSSLSLILSEEVIGKFVYSVINHLIDENQDYLIFEKLIEKNQALGHYNLELDGDKLTTIFKKSNEPLSEEDLTSGIKPRFLQPSFNYKGDLFYLSTEWTNGSDGRLDFVRFKRIFEKLYPHLLVEKDHDVYKLYTRTNRKSYNSKLINKSFVLLAGISGTGKTRFIREQAEQSGSLGETYQLVPVRPDWHEPSDLLGYVSRLNGKPEYVATDVLKFVVKAWQAILKAGFDFDGEKITGNKNSLESVAPYWLCLDEMNLAPVEQYFADYLSVIETRKWAHAGDDIEYTCDALLNAKLINEVADSLRTALGLADAGNDALWDHFTEFGISLPFNLIVAGTVNMDETTHGFSRKVLDRALSFDFGEFFPNNFDTFFAPDTQNLTLSYPIWSDGRNLDALSTTIDTDGSKSVAFLKAVNTALDNTPFKLAFRALNELLLAVICTQPKTEQALMAVWDDFVMCKVLPRIEGDIDKLAVSAGAGSNNGGEQRTVLSELKKVLTEQMPSIWDGEQRPDLYRENTTPDATGSSTILIACRSNKKLGWMEQRLSSASFTSFWP